MEYWENLSLENLTYLNLDGSICTEEWKAIVGCEGYYEISNLGRVKRIKRTKWSDGKILKAKIDRYGYLVVHLSFNKITLYKTIHRLVGIAFIPNTENKPEINHKKGIKYRNMVWELEWVTMRENQRHRSLMTPSSSKHIGVYWNKANKNWRTRIIINRKSIEIGSFSTEEEAAKAYEKKYNEYITSVNPQILIP